MKQEPPQHMVDMSKPGMWAKTGSYFLFVLCVFAMLFAATERSSPEAVGINFCGAMLALIASILLFDRYKRETSD